MWCWFTTVHNTPPSQGQLGSQSTANAVQAPTPVGSSGSTRVLRGLLTEADEAAVAEYVRVERTAGRMQSHEAMVNRVHSVQTKKEGASSTLDQYMCHVRRIARVKDDAGRPLAPSPANYCEFLSKCRAQGVHCAHATAYRMMSAMAFMVGVSGRAVTDSENKMMTMACEGYVRQFPEEPAPVKGAITAEQLDQLIQWMYDNVADEDKARTLAEGVEMQWALALRGSQVATLTLGQIQKLCTKHEANRGSAWFYSGPRHKKSQAHKKLLDTERHWCAPEKNKFVSEFIARRAAEAKKNGESPDDALLFSGWSMKAANEAIKAAAAEFKWSALTKYNGTHCLRHGAIASAWKRGGDDASKQAADQESPVMRRHYGQQNEEREAQARSDGGVPSLLDPPVGGKLGRAIKRRDGTARLVSARDAKAVAAGAAGRRPIPRRKNAARPNVKRSKKAKKMSNGEKTKGKRTNGRGR